MQNFFSTNFSPIFDQFSPLENRASLSSQNASRFNPNRVAVQSESRRSSIQIASRFNPKCAGMQIYLRWHMTHFQHKYTFCSHRALFFNSDFLIKNTNQKHLYTLKKKYIYALSYKKNLFYQKKKGILIIYGSVLE